MAEKYPAGPPPITTTLGTELPEELFMGINKKLMVQKRRRVAAHIEQLVDIHR
jgi:hypothetical protein